MKASRRFFSLRLAFETDLYSFLGIQHRKVHTTFTAKTQYLSALPRLLCSLATDLKSQKPATRKRRACETVQQSSSSWAVLVMEIRSRHTTIGKET